MKNDDFKELIVGVVLIVLLVFHLNPFGFYMPSAAAMLLLCGIVVLVLIWLSFIWKEKPQDERENLHRLLAGRVAFLVGAGILLLGIAVQGLQHNLDPWLPVALGGMVIAKLAARAYGRTKL
ncbi:MAG: hypothetical protein AAB538_02765 [Patescibacteria group bacterium]